MQALLAKYPQQFRMNVYTTGARRPCRRRSPTAVREQAPKVQLNGFGLRDLGGSTTPFPIPSSGLEAI